MNLQQFKYILAVAEYRHFELAAQKCFITQSTLSTMISKFEDEIGIRIFDRNKKPVEISNEGLLILEQIKIIVNQVSQLDELVNEVKGEIKGNIRLAIIPTVSPYLLPLFLPSLARKYPLFKLEVREQTTNEIIRQIKSRDLDIGIASIPLQEKELIEIELYQEPFVLYDGRGVKKTNAHVHLLDVQNLWLMEEGHCMRTQVLSICDLKKKKNAPVKNIDFKAGSIESLLNFVKVHKGTTLLPYLSTLKLNKEDTRHVRQFATPIPMRSIGMIVHRHFVKKKALGLFKNHILASVGPVLELMNKKGMLIKPI